MLITTSLAESSMSRPARRERSLSPSNAHNTRVSVQDVTAHLRRIDLCVSRVASFLLGSLHVFGEIFQRLIEIRRDVSDQTFARS